MVRTRLSSKHGFAPSKPLMETLSFQSSGRNKHLQLCVKQVSSAGGPNVQPVCVCLCLFLCVGAVGEGLLKYMWFVFWPSCIETHSTTHSCLEPRFPHLCCGSNITAHPASICCRQGTLPCTSPGVRNASCLTHLQSPSSSSEITPSLLMSDTDS